MPALKMKNNLSDDCARHRLHPKLKCTKVSKIPLDRAICQTELLSALIQNPIEVNYTSEESHCDIDSAACNDHHEYFSEAQAPFPDFPILSCAPTTDGRTGSSLMSCIPVLETIFSPSLMTENAELDLINQYNSDEGQHELPHLVADESDDRSSHSSNSQTCSALSSHRRAFGSLDFCISESVSTSLPMDGDLGFVKGVTADLPDCDSMTNNTVIGMSERFMVLPFIDKTFETNDVRELIEDVINADDACLYLAFYQLRSSSQECPITSQYVDHDGREFFDPPFGGLSDLPDFPESVSCFKPALVPPKETLKRKSATLVLDLDETLVHSSLEHCEDADFSFPVFFNMKENMVYVKRRPYLQLFLETVASMFEIVVFTASQSIYAAKLLDILDPDKNLVSRRIYRESCIFSDGSYTKDLTILGVDLAKVAIVDNTPQVFQLQVNNGIPIKSWFDDPSDHALISLLPFLETLADAYDVRPLIAEKFGGVAEE